MSTADPAATILLVEDDAPTRTFLADNLTADGYELLVAECARDGLRLLETKFPDVALVDLGLPDGSGLDIVRRVRASDGVASRIDPAVPLVVLSGRGGELDRLRGFDRGCDDYVCKPFSYPELRARIEALLRRADARRRPGRLRIGELEIDAASRDGAPARRRRSSCRRRSSRSCARWPSDPTRVFTKDELLRTIWGFRTLGSTRTLDSHACRLRHKLGRGGDRFVVNVWGVGYRLVDGPPPELAGGAERPAAGSDADPPPLAPAAALAGLPLLARRRAAGRRRGPRVVAARGRGARPGRVLAPAAGPAARARGAGLPRAARAAHRRAPRPARGVRRGDAPPARLAAVDRELDRAAVALDDLAAARNGRRAPDRDEPGRRRRPARLPGADLADGARASSAAGSSSSEPGCGGDGARRPRAPRRRPSATSSPTRSSTATGAVRAAGARARATGCASRSPTTARACPRRWVDLTRRPRAGRGRRGRGLAIAADIADRHGGRLVAAPTARGARVALELPAWHERA